MAEEQESSTETYGVQAEVSISALESLASHHPRPFSAFAELIDNAYDADVNATEIWIYQSKFGKKDCLVFEDDGNGLADLGRLKKMLSLGFCDKGTETGGRVLRSRKPIGCHGFGFKSSTMRLAKDALIFTVGQERKNACIGLLSRSCPEETVLRLPMVQFELQGNSLQPLKNEGMKNCLLEILKKSPFQEEDELLEPLKAILQTSKKHGTKIILFNLNCGPDGSPELKFDTKDGIADIVVRRDESSDENEGPEYERSLRVYLSILYEEPRLRIYITDKKNAVEGVKLDRYIREDSRKTYEYKPKSVDGKAKIIIGKLKSGAPSVLKEPGALVFHNKRLIKPFIRLGAQSKTTEQLIVFVDASSILKPTPNKQDFENHAVYGNLISAVNRYLRAYTGQDTGAEEEEPTPDRPVQVQAHERRLPGTKTKERKAGDSGQLLVTDSFVPRGSTRSTPFANIQPADELSADVKELLKLMQQHPEIEVPQKAELLKLVREALGNFNPSQPGSSNE